jgi:hypothetical protein
MNTVITSSEVHRQLKQTENERDKLRKQLNEQQEHLEKLKLKELETLEKQIKSKPEPSVVVNNSTTHTVPISVDVVQAQSQLVTNNTTTSTISDCVVCMNVQSNVVTKPCGHLAMCEQCALQIIHDGTNECPICRKSIVEHIKVYVS